MLWCYYSAISISLRIMVTCKRHLSSNLRGGSYMLWVLFNMLWCYYSAISIKILKIILGCNPYVFRAQPTLHLVSFLSWAECGQCSQPNWPPPSWAECPLSSAHGPRPGCVAQQSQPSATCAGGFGYGPGGKECRWDKLGCLLLVLNIFQLCFQSKISFNKFLIFNPTNTI